MLGYECGTVGTDMVRKKASDSSCRQRSDSDNVVSSLKILRSSLSPHWGVHKFISHTPLRTKPERVDSLGSMAAL